MPKSQSVWFVYVVAATLAEARLIAKSVVQANLAACANILGGVESFYKWKGTLKTGKEVAVIFKTTRHKVTPLIGRVKKGHSYECPCIVAWKITKGLKPYLKWIDTQCS